VTGELFTLENIKFTRSLKEGPISTKINSHDTKVMKNAKTTLINGKLVVTNGVASFLILNPKDLSVIRGGNFQ
jgi:hypothetical protein